MDFEPPELADFFVESVGDTKVKRRRIGAEKPLTYRDSRVPGWVWVLTLIAEIILSAVKTFI